MAVAATVLSDTQRAVLEAVCDTYVPAVESSSSDPVEQSFLARSAGDLLGAAQIEGMFAETLLPEEIAQVAGLLDAIAGQGFLDAPLEGRITAANWPPRRTDRSPCWPVPLWAEGPSSTT